MYNKATLNTHQMQKPDLSITSAAGDIWDSLRQKKFKFYLLGNAPKG